MRTIYLLRHAKSSWDGGEVADHDRPLAGRGREAAPRIGRFLTRAGESPDAILTSSARRARETVQLAARAGGWECTVTVDPQLYGTPVATVLSRLRLADDTSQRLLVAGHEPTWSDLLSLLVGGGRFRLPTAAVARLDLQIERWQEIDLGKGELRWLVTPKLLAQLEF